MNKTMKIVLALAVVAAIAGFALLMSNSKDDKSTNSTGSNSNNSSSSDESNSGSSEDDSDVALTVTYDGTSFSESTNSIKAGQKVKVVNNSSVALDFDSDPHPVHTDNTELNVGDIEPGESQTFIVDKKGTWGYHNHLNSSQHGEIIVE